MHGKSGAKGGAVKSKAFYWRKRGKKVEGGVPGFPICNVFFSDNR